MDTRVRTPATPAPWHGRCGVLGMMIAAFALSLTAVGCAADPNPLPQYMQDAPRTDEDVKRAIGEIRKELGDEFMIDSLEGIFYLAANGGLDEYRRCRATVERMYRFLTTFYFEKKAIKPIRIYCFRDKPSYDKYCMDTYQRGPSTPFGFYMPSERKMVMNIATGTGTLAHETVHPLLAEDFPGVPSWFNEGFASLYEQSEQGVDGQMEGLVNWRLKGLREAMRDDRAVPLADLLKTSTKEFYDEARGVNYATARYLCKWLQDQKKLRDFYREFKATAKDDPTGRAALEKVAGMKLDEIDPKWREWVKDLK